MFGLSNPYLSSNVGARTIALISRLRKLLHMASCIAHESALGYHVSSAVGRPSVLWLRMPSSTGRTVLGSCGAKSDLPKKTKCLWHDSQTRMCSHHLDLAFTVKVGRPNPVTASRLNLRSLLAHSYTVPMLSVSIPCRTNRDASGYRQTR